MISVDEFLADIHRTGIQIWVDGGNVRCRAPKGRLTPELLNQITSRKADILLALGSLSDDQDERIPRIDRNAELPLSPAQQRLWFLDKYEADKSAYAISIALRLRGALRIDALRASINQIVERHEALRTIFPSNEGLPFQQILPVAPFDIQILEDLHSVVEDQASRPFDLATGPLLRVVLVRLAEDDHALVITVHHIVSDAWSVGVFVREFSELYTAACFRRAPILPELQIQYADFAAHQRHRLHDGDYDAQLAYWRTRLQDAPPLLDLPADRPRPAARTNRGLVESFQLTEALTAALKQLTKRYGCSIFMTLLTGFSALLARYTGQTDVVIGSPVANRNHRQLEPLIGFFVNTLALRVDLSNDPSWQDLLTRVKQIALDAFARQDIPFEDLVEKLQPKRSLSYTPLFQVMLVLQNTPISELELPDLAVSTLDVATDTAKFDLTLIVTDDGDRLTGSLQYSIDLFDTAKIRRMVGHFQELLSGMACKPAARVFETNLLVAGEAQHLLKTRHNSFIDANGVYCIHELFEHRSEHSPDTVALVFMDLKVTYAELNARCNRLAHYLISTGVRPDGLVLIAIERGVDMIVALLATLKAGGAYVPLDPTYPADRLAFVIADSAARVLITQRDVLPKLGELPDTLDVLILDADDSGWSTMPGTNPSSASLGLTPANLAYVIYTSGSTGTPKGVMVEHANVVRLFSSTAAMFGFSASDVWTLFHSYAFDFSVWEIWGALIYGGRVIIVPHEVARSPSDFFGLIREGQVTVLNQTPSAFQQLLAAQAASPVPLHRLRHVILGGEALEVSTLPRWFSLNDRNKTNLVNMYGITETTVHVTYRLLHPRDGENRHISPIGEPVPDLRVYLLDDRGAPVPVGVAGELFVGGAGVARGYLNRPELTAQRFLPDPFAAEAGHSGARMYRSGDLARWLEDGTLEFIGRNDGQVKIRGFRIELGEIEARLRNCPGITDAVVLAREDQPGEKRLVAYFVSTEAVALADLRGCVARSLPDYMVPAAFVRLDSLPLTSNGKLDRRALPAPNETAFANRAFAAPQGRGETELAALWAELLQVDPVGRHDNFFELGGHSLMAVQMVSRIREGWNRELTVRAVFEFPSVAELAAHLAVIATDASRSRPISRARDHGPLPVSYAQERLWFLDQLEPGNAFYNIPFAFRCTGSLDETILRQSLNEIVRRHASLRTTFYEIDGKPHQKIQEHVPIHLERQSLTDLGTEQREAEARRLALMEALRPFDLRAGPLIRGGLIDLAPDDYVLLLTIHHIVADGWSMGVLVEEFSQIYPAFLRGEPSPLPDLDIQFADFAVWQRDWLSGDSLQVEIDYWKRQLYDVPHVLELPADFQRPPTQTFRGASQPFHLPGKTTDRLKSIGQRADASLFMTLFAAFCVLMRRYTGEDGFLIGSPIANRNETTVEPLIGFFVNTLALRADLSGDPPFEELLHRVRQTTLDAYAHPNVPFEFLVERLQPLRDMRRNPLVQVSFVFQNTPLRLARIENLELRQLRAETGTARFDLEVFLWEQDGELRGEFAYYTDLFAAQTIARLVGHFQTLLGGIADDPTARVSALPLLAVIEQHQLLKGWNATAAEFPADKCVHELIEEQAVFYPDEVAVSCGDVSLTYRQLTSRANQLAHYLRTLGAGPGVLIGLYLRRSIDLVVSVLAVLKSGSAYLPLDPGYPPDRTAFMIEDSGLAILLTRTLLPPANQAHVVCLDETSDIIDCQSTIKPRSNVQPSDLAYVIYTSGSTGRPKGAMLEHRNVVNYLAWARANYGVGEGIGAPVNSSISFDATVTSLITPLTAGRHVELLPEQNEIEHLCAALASERRYSLVKITPAHLDMLAALFSGTRFEGRVRAFVIGGEALTADHVAYWRKYAPDVRLFNEYGPTETVVGCCVYEVPSDGPVPSNIPIGRPIANTQLYVLDEHLRPVPIGVPGELFIGGAGVGRGYLSRTDLTSERFIPDPFSPDLSARLYKTGDRARYLSDGNLEYLGRFDSQVKLRGYRIETGEIERVLTDHPAVDKVLVTLRKDQPGDDRLVAYIVPRPALSEGVPSGTSIADSDKAEQLDQWQQVFQDSYANSQTADDLTFDIAGWNSSYTGRPIPAMEMKEWVDATVDRIRSHAPRRIWEIGCGTGLLLSRLAPDLEHYLGTDFSATALGRLQQLVDRSGLQNVQLLHRRADDAADIAGPFDMIVINSVVQYFPSADYLLGVLDESVTTLDKGGIIFLGDVRCLRLLETFHASVEVHRASDTTSVSELRQRIGERMGREEELLLDPRFFFALKSRYPSLTHVAADQKRGKGCNELLRFRYDVTLCFDGTVTKSQNIPWREWCPQDLRQTLNGPTALRRIPNARLHHDMITVHELGAASGKLSARQLKQRVQAAPPSGIDPEDLWALGAELGYRVDIGVSEDPSCFDAIFQPYGMEVMPVPAVSFAEAIGSWRNYVSDPLALRRHQWLGQDLRTLAASKLPDYMIPSAFVMLRQFPLSANGKIDRDALPAPSGRPADETLISPRTPDEHALAAIWSDVLRLDRVGINADFFALGGHSLLATQVISRVREAFAVELQVRAVFEAPTIALLAQRIAGLRAAAADLPPGPALRPQPRVDQIPLSFAQERLWLLDRLEDKSSAYNIASALRVTGPLNLEGLRYSFAMLIDRHEVLRTTFLAAQGGAPYQRIADRLDFELPVIDVEPSSEIERNEQLDRFRTNVHQAPFDLRLGPLLRATLLRLGEREHILLTCIHHIISDGWSIGVMNAELAEFYEAFLEKRPHHLAQLPVQYADYAIWHRGWLHGEVMQSQISYWKKQLAGAPAVLDLPTDFPRPAVQSFLGDMEIFELDQDLTEDLASFSGQHGASQYMTLLAVFAVLLFRYSGEKDLVIGSPIAGRRVREVEPLIGFFVNTLAMRADLNGDPDFVELIGRLRKTTLDAYANQDAPFEYLVQELNPKRSLSHAPVFQVMFVLLNTPLVPVTVSDVTFAPVDSNTASAKFDLTLCLGPSGDGMWGWFEYRTDLFQRATVRRMIDHFVTLLKGAVRNPTVPVSRLPLMSAAERQQPTSSHTVQPFLAVHRRFEAQAEATPEQTAAEFEGASLSYRQLNHRANRLAHRLVESGIGPDKRVGICLERGLDLVISVLATLKAGGCYVPLDPSYPANRLAFMFQDAQIDVLLTQRTLQETVPQTSAQTILVDGTAAFGSSNDLLADVDADNLAYVIYTSGSSGQPKGIAMRHGALANLINWQLTNVAGFGPARTLQFTSLSFDVSFQEMFSAWCSGGTLVLVSDATRTDPRALANFLGERRIERLFLPFVALQQLASSATEQNFAALALRDIVTAGERLRITPELSNLMRRLPGCRLHNHYGPAETHVVAAFILSSDVDDWPELPPIGRPVDNTRLYILDEHQQPVPVGVPGELYIGGECLARGYWQRPDLTEDRFVTDLFSTNSSDRLYRTGDRARYLNDGNLEFLGRIDDQVKIRGFRVEPGEVEAELAKCPAVRDVAVVAREDDANNRRLVAYIVPYAPDVIREAELRDFVRASLPDYSIPSVFVIMRAFPVTPSGKVDRRALPAPDPAGAPSASYAAPRNRYELRLAEIWEEALGRRPVGIRDDFFELGGHSLLAVRVMARIEEAWGVSLPLATLFQHSTIELLAARLYQHPTTDPHTCVVPIRTDGSLPPFFVAPGAGGNVLYLYELALRLGRDQPFYGLQAVGLDGRAAPARSIEEMAAHYVREIMDLYPVGPVFLGGHSFGGAVAYELSQQLQRAGRVVALLAVLDTNAPHTIEPSPLTRPDDAAWLAEIGAIINDLSGREIAISAAELRCLDAEQQLAAFRTSLILSGWLPPETTLTQIRAFVDVYKANIQIDYRPRDPIATPILLLKTVRGPGANLGELSLDEILGPAWGWDELALGQVDIATVPGNHLTMMTVPHVQTTADELRKRLTLYGGHIR